MGITYSASDAPTESDAIRRDPALVHQCGELRDRCLEYFRKWEKRNGFKRGAGIILVQAGWNESMRRRTAG